VTDDFVIGRTELVPGSLGHRWKNWKTLGNLQGTAIAKTIAVVGL